MASLGSSEKPEMIYDDVDFHNVAELHKDESPGLRLQRVPESVRLHLNRRAQQRMLAAAATEIRFVTTGDRITVARSSDSGTELIPFFARCRGESGFGFPMSRPRSKL